MTYNRTNNENSYDDGRKSGEPHPDAQRNLQFCLDFLRTHKIADYLEYRYHNIKPGTDIIDPPMYIMFSWKEFGNNFGCPISFHQNSDKFQTELKKFLGYETEAKYKQYR